MNRRGFLTSLAALATTAVLPKAPTIPVASLYNPLMYKLAMNSMYGKMYQGGRVVYAAFDGVITTDIRSAYPSVYEKIKSLRTASDAQVYQEFHS